MAGWVRYISTHGPSLKADASRTITTALTAAVSWPSSTLETAVKIKCTPEGLLQLVTIRIKLKNYLLCIFTVSLTAYYINFNIGSVIDDRLNNMGFYKLYLTLVLSEKVIIHGGKEISTKRCILTSYIQYGKFMFQATADS